MNHRKFNKRFIPQIVSEENVRAYQFFRIKTDDPPVITSMISENPLMEQVVDDVRSHLAEHQQLQLWWKVEKFMDEHLLNFHPGKRAFEILKAMSTYVTSRFYYGNVVVEWVKSLMDTAVLENRKVIFLARDGIAPYKAAKIIKSLNPKRYENVELYLLYISRTLAYSSVLQDESISSSDDIVKKYLSTLDQRDPFILQKYFVQEADLQQRDRLIIVDVGFSGSVIQPILSQLEAFDVDVAFNYLISHVSAKKVPRKSDRPKWFLADREKRPLSCVDKAGGNPAVHWIEDTHQSVVETPKVLIARDDGIVPAVVKKQGDGFVTQEVIGNLITRSIGKPSEYLIKSFGIKGVLDAARVSEQENTPLMAWREASDLLREEFSEFLTSLYTRERSLLLEH